MPVPPPPATAAEAKVPSMRQPRACHSRSRSSHRSCAARSPKAWPNLGTTRSLTRLPRRIRRSPATRLVRLAGVSWSATNRRSSGTSANGPARETTAAGRQSSETSANGPAGETTAESMLRFLAARSIPRGRVAAIPPRRAAVTAGRATVPSSSSSSELPAGRKNYAGKTGAIRVHLLRGRCLVSRTRGRFQGHTASANSIAQASAQSEAQALEEAAGLRVATSCDGSNSWRARRLGRAMRASDYQVSVPLSCL